MIIIIIIIIIIIMIIIMIMIITANCITNVISVALKSNYNSIH